jgi:transcription-repair coupling factor (superfamily II helicase)
MAWVTFLWFSSSFGSSSAFLLPSSRFKPDQWHRKFSVKPSLAKVAETDSMQGASASGNNINDIESVKRVSVLRSGSTQIGPAARQATIFPGDYVVHSDKGVAQYLDEVDDGSGGRTILLGFQQQVEYAVPPEERSKLSRLKAGDASSPPKLAALTEKGLRQWQSTLDKVRESTRQQAGGILDLYAARNDLYRAPCPPDSDEFCAFEERFVWWYN